MKIPLALISTLCLTLTGCLPLQQSAFSGGHQGDHFGHYGDYGLLTIGDGNQPKKTNILADQSYALSPRGIRYHIKTSDHPFDISQRYPYIRDQIRIYDPKGREIKSLSYGPWVFVFKLKTEHGIQERTFSSTVSTFYYNPILHGPPN